ncbi:MAG: ribonuclease R, partial [Coriobacteriia bacterium]|nr:ribonuclease R [Coriobacteriia bacterium]
MARREKRVRKASQSGLIVGRIEMNRKGYGFVEASEGDIYVAVKHTNGAMHGDVVGVRLRRSKGRPGRAGVVMKVLERAHESVVGRFHLHGRVGIVIPSDVRLRNDIFIDSRNTAGAENGDIVVVRLTMYPSRHAAAQGVVEEVL